VKNSLLAVLRVLSLVLMIFSATMLVPWGVSYWLKDGAQFAYDEGIVITLSSGTLLWFFTRHHKRELRIKDGFLLVVLAWTVVPAFATIPLLAYFWPRLSFTDAYFEAVSGMTTTGATVLEGLDKLPYSINFWRGELVWLGGMGLIVLVVAILPLLGVGGRQIFKAEAPGPMKDSKLTPRMTETAKGLWLVYLALTVACALSLKWAGMDWQDAVMHCFSIMGLGGFSTHDASFGHFNSVAIEVVSIFFMTLCGMNFATHFVALRGRSARPYWFDPEIRWYLFAMYTGVLLVTYYLWAMGTYPDFWTALRFAAFNTVSIATTTGFANTDYNLWPMFAPLWMLFMSSFITCSGSTGGGIKLVRAMILYKQVFLEILRAMHPSVVRPIKLAGQPLPANIVYAVLAFGFMYMVTLVSLTLVMAFSGLDIITGFSAVVACVNNTGPGLNQVGPATTFAVLNDFQTWVCTFGMLLGRLEIFTLLVVLSPAFWEK